MDPCSTRRFGLAALLLFGLIARPAAAQPPSTAFDQLPSRVRVGDTVWVAGEDGREEKGKLWTLSPSSLEIMSNGQSKVFQAGSVRAVWTRDRDSLANGALIGLVTGMVVAALAAATCYDVRTGNASRSPGWSTAARERRSASESTPSRRPRRSRCSGGPAGGRRASAWRRRSRRARRDSPFASRSEIDPHAGEWAVGGRVASAPRPRSGRRRLGSRQTHGARTRGIAASSPQTTTIRDRGPSSD